jgi:hypothetical protein
VSEGTAPRTAGGPVLRERLADAVRRAGATASGMVVLIGEPHEAEALWDDALGEVGGRRRGVWRPADAGELLARLRAPERLVPLTAIRITDLRAVLMPGDAGLGAEVAAGLRGALHRRGGSPLLVAATMPADRDSWRSLTDAPASGGPDRWSQARALLHRAAVLTVGTAFPHGRVPVRIGTAAADAAGAAGEGEGPGPVRGPAGDSAMIGENHVVMMGAALRGGVPRWMPSALPNGQASRPGPEEMRRLGIEQERLGNVAGAVRLYERAAHEGDLVALSRIAALRPDQAADREREEDAAAEMFRRASQERNTAVLFGLAAVGHTGALDLLGRLRREAASG